MWRLSPGDAGRADTQPQHPGFIGWQVAYGDLQTFHGQVTQQESLLGAQSVGPEVAMVTDQLSSNHEALEWYCDTGESRT